MDGAGVFECELALASSVIFFGYVTTILPICSPKQVSVKEAFQLGDLSCLVKNGLWVGEGRGVPGSRKGEVTGTLTHDQEPRRQQLCTCDQRGHGTVDAFTPLGGLRDPGH